MSLRVAVDFGTSSTCVAVSVDGREPQVVVVDGQPLVSSAVFAAADGTLFVGQEAERQAAIDPARYEPHPKRRIDEGELLLGNTVIAVLDVVRAVLTRAVSEARRLAGGAPVELLVLTHPADWGAVRTRVLRQAAAGLAGEVALVPEPVAAAVFHTASHALPDGAALAVLDLGGGTVDVSVVRRVPRAEPDRGQLIAGFRVLATHGDPNFGGADIDQLLLEHVGRAAAEVDPDAWRELVEGREMVDRRRRRVLRQDVRGAKETLSRHTYTDVPLPPPFQDAHVTRDDLERLIAEPLGRAATLTMDSITDAGLRPERLAAVFLVGGSSRIPLVARLVRERTGIMPTTLDQPETVVARGALRAVTLDPLRTGGLPGVGGGRPSGGASRPAGGFPTPAGGGRLSAPPRPPGPVGPNRPSGPPGGPSGPGGPNGPGGPPPRFGAGPASYAGPAPAEPAAPVRRGRKRLLWLSAAVVVVVAAATVGIVLFTRSDSGPTNSGSQRFIAQYEYQFPLPTGWTQNGGNAQKQEVEIAPTDAQTGPAAIFVAEFRLAYDSTTDPQGAISALQQEVQAAHYVDFNSKLQFAGRSVTYYRDTTSANPVDWYVVFQGKVQVSVGCQYPTGGQATVEAACQQVVGGLTITS
ncbi:MAG TPA: type VII secretion-associated protein [Pseudonocardiaceae bacterium]|nr:type VII secretion-associated protein [Pseudonocardiaceae bacterium]